MDADVWKAFLSFDVAAATLALTWGIGSQVTARWAEWGKRRELELSLANTFYSHYGKFRAVWRLWNQSLKDLSNDPAALKKKRETLFDRACRAEGGLEAVLLKVASERVLLKGDQEDLGNLRQAFQVLRERIGAGLPIAYGSSQDKDYLEFKRLATRLGTLLASPPASRTPSPQQACEAFQEITHNKYEQRWKLAGRRTETGAKAECTS